MTHSLDLHLRNQFGAIAEASQAMRAFLERHGVPADARFTADLVLEEMVTNTIKYGYDDAGAHTIEVRVSIAGARLAIRISDDGHPFNPLDLPVPDTTLPAGERPIGGLGIHFVRNLADSLDYAREDGRNVVTVTKAFAPAPAA
jgi:anti-sigma regulatory factor (Ser/Thr protein kinase)